MVVPINSLVINLYMYCSKTCLKQSLEKKTKIGFRDRLSLNEGQKYCRMLEESILQYFRPPLSQYTLIITGMEFWYMVFWWLRSNLMSTMKFVFLPGKSLALLVPINSLVINLYMYYSKTCLKRSFKKKTKTGFQDQQIIA